MSNVYADLSVSQASLSELCAPKLPMPSLSIIIPIYNEATTVVANIQRLINTVEQQNLSSGPYNKNESAAGIEIIVVDGGSTDGTFDLLKNFKSAISIISSDSGRATQMNAGADVAKADTLLFLHIDTFLPEDFYQALMSGLYPSKIKTDTAASAQGSFECWGRFDVELSSSKSWARLVGFMINWRSRTFSIATGDQALFMTRHAFDRVGGFPRQRLMEDVEMTKRLKHNYTAPICLREKVQTSSRRWEKNGVVRTILLMWQLRLYYYFGVSSDKLYKKYYE